MNRKQRRAAKKDQGSVIELAQLEDDDSRVLDPNFKGGYTLRYWLQNTLCITIAEAKHKAQEHGLIIPASEYVAELKALIDSGDLEQGIASMSDVFQQIENQK